MQSCHQLLPCFSQHVFSSSWRTFSQIVPHSEAKIRLSTLLIKGDGQCRTVKSVKRSELAAADATSKIMTEWVEKYFSLKFPKDKKLMELIFNHGGYFESFQLKYRHSEDRYFVIHIPKDWTVPYLADGHNAGDSEAFSVKSTFSSHTFRKLDVLSQLIKLTWLSESFDEIVVLKKE